MTRIQQITAVLLFMGGLFSCTEESSDINAINQISGTTNWESELTVNEILFKGSLIHLEEEGNEDEIYTIPEITLQKSDIKFRAKRIPSELYLKNKGVKGEELLTALDEVKGEQLFYFEFEEQQKRDLIKKHLDDNLDANISYLAFDIYNDFLLVNSKGDTLQSDYSLYERDFHVAPYERLLVSFSGVDQDEELVLIYNDKIFKQGKLSFHFASSKYLENNIKNPS